MCVLMIISQPWHYCYLVAGNSLLCFPGRSVMKNLPANAGDMGLIPGLGRSPADENGSLLHMLTWEIPWTEEPGHPQSMGSQRVGHDLETK